MYVCVSFFSKAHAEAYLIVDFDLEFSLGHGNNNPVGRRLANYIIHGQVIILGPDFPTVIRNNSATTPDLVITNNYANFNTQLSQCQITTSDHLPIQFIISTSP